MEIKIVEMVKYNGHSIKNSGAIDLSFKAMYSELTKSIQALQLLNNDVTLAVKKANEKPFKVGIFRIKNVIIDGDGESTLKFVSITDAVELNQLNDIISSDEYQIAMKANIEKEDEDE